MNRAIYIETIKKILKQRFVVFMLLAMGVLLPLSLILAPTPTVTSVDGWDAFAVSTIIGLITVTATNAIGNSLSIGGRSDYMPLIFTRPLHRYQYVISKWLALATVIAVVSVLQNLLFTTSGAFTRWGLTDEMIVLDFFERIISALSVSSVLTMIYLLPTQTMVLSGVIAFELAAGISILAMSIAVPMPETATDVSVLLCDILGIDDWIRTTFIPALFGGSALSSIQQYIAAIINLSNFLAPQIHLYDILETRPFVWSALLEPISNILIALTIATAVLNAREYHYDVD
ncbi:MAG: hypothetical protein SGJ27_20435 [Candidatus Melainabacteria bacterium]|nr:hypothetical protein [Candidatus Melainabacteria bacterium]